VRCDQGRAFRTIQHDSELIQDFPRVACGNWEWLAKHPETATWETEMNIALKVSFSSCAGGLRNPGRNALTSICIAVSAFVFSGVSMAQQAPPPGPGTAVVEPGVHATHFGLDEIPPGTYDVNTKETLVRYGVDHMGFSEYWGTFPGTTGTLAFDPKHVGATKLEVKVPIFLVETTNKELDGQLFSDEFFDAEDYPYMKFSSTEVIRTGPKTFKVTGNLTMHNITRPIVLSVTFHGAGNDPFTGKDIFVGFDAKGTVMRSAFGLGKYVPIVSDETTITISAEFKKRRSLTSSQ
jgi:polyisoprenoid-binding protein YceI